MYFLNFSNLSYVLSQTCPKMCPRPDMSWKRPRHVPNVYSKCPCPDHFGTSPKCPEYICLMSFLNFSNFSYVLSQICLKMCPRPDISRTRPGHVPDVSSKCPCPDHFGTSLNRTSATKLSRTRKFYRYMLCGAANDVPHVITVRTDSVSKLIVEDGFPLVENYDST